MSAPQSYQTHALESQVGGHPGVLTTEDGSLIIKPALPKEVAFYTLLSTNEQLAPLLPHVPRYMGTIKPTAVVQGSEADTPANQAEIQSGKESIVLENVSASFKRPNILDIKLGTVLYEEDASDEKKERMIKTAKATTSFETGIRLTGFQVYDPVQKVTVNTPKAYGKSIASSQLPEGIAKFFPSTWTSEPALLVAVIEGILDKILAIKAAWETLELRMVGGSLLIVWEGDEDALRKCIAESGKPSVPAEVGDGGDVEEGSEDEEDEEDAPKAYAVKLIDFAHTRLVPGEGPDKGVLLGMETTIKLLRGRIAELGQMAS